VYPNINQFISNSLLTKINSLKLNSVVEFRYKDLQNKNSEMIWDVLNAPSSRIFRVQNANPPRFNRPFPKNRGFRTSKRYYVIGSVTHKELWEWVSFYFQTFLCIFTYCLKKYIYRLFSSNDCCAMINMEYMLASLKPRHNINIGFLLS